MAARVYCKTTAKDVQSYFLTDGKNDYYLFNSGFRRSNKEFFSQGRFIQEVLDARRHVSASVQRISIRLISAIRYIESEYGICVLQRTAKKQQKKRSVKSFEIYDRRYELAAV